MQSDAGQGSVRNLQRHYRPVEADQALKQANETLEQRVSERTAELTRVNHALAEARAAADEANIGKTRFSQRRATTSCSR